MSSGIADPGVHKCHRDSVSFPLLLYAKHSTKCNEKLDHLFSLISLGNKVELSMTPKKYSKLRILAWP